MEVVLTGCSIDTADRVPDIALPSISTPSPSIQFGVIQGTGIEIPDLVNLADYNSLETKKDIYYFIGG